MMQKCGNCIWHDDNAVCKNPDALMVGNLMDDLSWCEKYKRKKWKDALIERWNRRAET